jgi:hypothetical protein
MDHTGYLYSQRLSSNSSVVMTSLKLSETGCLLAHLGMVLDPVALKVGVTFLTMLLHSRSHRLEDQVTAMIDQLRVFVSVTIVVKSPVFLVSLVLLIVNCLTACFPRNSHHFLS